MQLMSKQVSATRSPAQEEADEAFLRHRAPRALLQLGGLMVLSFFVFLGGLLREPGPGRRQVPHTFSKVHFGLSETSESAVKPVLPPVAIFRAGVTGLGAV